MDSLLSFPVGLFHPLQHDGLSRRSPVGRQSGRYRMVAQIEMPSATTFTKRPSYSQIIRSHENALVALQSAVGIAEVQPCCAREFFVPAF